VTRRSPQSPNTELDSVVKLRAALGQKARIADALREVGTALGQSEDLDDVLELLLKKTRELLDSDRATLFLLDETTGELVSRITGGEEIRSVRLRVGYGIAGYVAQTGETLRIHDAYTDPRFEPQWDQLTAYRTRTMLATPLKNHLGAIIGVIQVLNKHHGQEFTSEDEELVIALSTQAAVVIDNSRLVLRLKEKNRQLLEAQEALERRVRDLSLLFQLERATAHATSVESLVSAVLSHVVPACGADAGLLSVREEDGQQLRFMLTDDSSRTLVRDSRRSSEGFLAELMDEPDIRRVTVERGHLEDLGLPGTFRGAHLVAAPLEGEDRPLGVLVLLKRKAESAFGDDDEELIRLVSANVSTAMRLFRSAAAREKSERLTAIGTLLSQVIHDFKTPMTVISGYAQLMVEQQDQERRAAYSEEIVRQFEIITAMQREVLEFARGERTLFARRIHLGRFMDELTREVSRALEKTAIHLVIDVDRKAVARFDEVRMSRALHNLVRNAIEAMGSHPGTLRLTASRRAESLCFSVADTGPGIPKEVEGKLFQSFVTAKKPGGSGLGLAIVKKIVDEHAGTIDVHSSAKGTEFIVTLPQSKDSQRPPDASLVPSVVPAREPRSGGRHPSSRPPAR